MIDLLADRRMWVLFFTAGESSSSAERDRTTDESREPLKGFALRRRVRQTGQRFTKPFQNNRGFHLTTNTFSGARTMPAITLGGAVAIISAQLSAASLSIALVSDQLSPSALVLKNAAGKLLRADRGDQAASYFGRFAFDLPAGRYQLVGYAARFPVGMRLPVLEDYKPARAYPDSQGWFDVSTSTSVKLHLNTTGGLGLVTTMDGTAANDVVQPRALQWLQGMQETPDGRWAVIAATSSTEQKLLVADQKKGQWQLHARFSMLRPLALTGVGADQFVVSGEAGQLLWIAADGKASAMSSNGLPNNSLLLPRCDTNYHCVVAALTQGKDAAFFYSRDARVGDWQKRADLPAPTDCGWGIICNSFAPTFAADGLLFAFDGKKQLVSIAVADGNVQSYPLKPKVDTIATAGNQLWIGNQMSTDRGKTWQTDANSPRATDGAEYRMGRDFSFRAVRPMIERREAGGKWRELASPPSYGTYLVATKSDRQYFLNGADMQVSLDRGRTWQPDASFHQAIDIGAVQAPSVENEDAPMATNMDNATQKTVLLVDAPIANLRTAFRQPYYANTGLVLNMMIANDEQVLKDELLASMRQCMDKKVIGNAVAKGLRDEMNAQGYPSVTTIVGRAPSYTAVRNVKQKSDYVLLVTGGAENKYGNNTPTGILLDHRQLRVDFRVQLLKRNGSDAKRVWGRDVTVYSDPIDLQGPGAARQAWCANQGARLQSTLTSIAQTAAQLAFVSQNELAVDEKKYVDLVTELGADRLPGQLVSFENQRAVIRDHDQRIYSVPALKLW